MHFNACAGLALVNCSMERPLVGGGFERMKFKFEQGGQVFREIAPIVAAGI